MYFDLGPLCMYSRPNLFVHLCIAHLLEVSMATLVHCGIVPLLIYFCICVVICKRLHLSACLTLLLPRFHAIDASDTVHHLHLATPMWQHSFNIFKSCYKIQGTVAQGCINPGCHIAVATTFFMVLPIFLGLQYGTCFVLLFWLIQF